MNAPRPLFIDTDPGVDDAWAILMAAAAPDVALVGMSVVGGNVGLEHTLRNTRSLVDLIGRPIPIYPGAAMPLLALTEDAAHVHGMDGFGDANLVEPSSPVSSTAAAVGIVRLANQYAGELELIALGPLTNLALALRLDPSLPQLVKRLLIMGGAIDGPGNTTPFAEFNIGFDPEAAEIVFREWGAIELADWSATLREAPPVHVIESILAGSTAKSRFMHAISRKTADFVVDKGADHWAFADPLAMLAMLFPERVAGGRSGSIQIVLNGERRGATDLFADDPNRAQVRVHEQFSAGALQLALELALR